MNHDEDEFPNLMSPRTLAAAVFMVFLAAVVSDYFRWGFAS